MIIKNSSKKENNEAELIIEAEPEEVEAAVHSAFLKNKNRISVPGFRKGKAPRKIIERMYGAEIFHSDALDILLPDALGFAMKESELNTVGYPKVNDVEFIDNNTRVEITLIAALHPEVIVGNYKGLKAPKPAVEIPESEIDNEIESIRKRNARIEKADRAAASGDIAVIDFEGFVDGEAFEGGKGENYELELGSGSFIPGFEEKVEGMNVGEQCDLELVFPDDYKEELAGKPVIFKVTLNEVKEKILPELDDEFAMDVSEFDTLDEYKADIREKITTTRQKDIDETFESQLIEQVIESMEADIPEAMVEEQMEISMENFNKQMSAYGMTPTQYMQMTGATPESFRERMRDSSEKQVKVKLALEKIAELEGIEVSDEEIEDEYKAAAERFNTDTDKLKETVTRDTIMRELKLRGAVKIVVDSAIAEEPDDEDEEKTSDKNDSTAKNPAVKKGDADNIDDKKEQEK